MSLEKEATSPFLGALYMKFVDGEYGFYDKEGHKLSDEESKEQLISVIPKSIWDDFDVSGFLNSATIWRVCMMRAAEKLKLNWEWNVNVPDEFVMRWAERASMLHHIGVKSKEITPDIQKQYDEILEEYLKEYLCNK